MIHIEQLRSTIIDKLLAIDNQELLQAFNAILESKSSKKVHLTSVQKELLQLSVYDIASGDVLSQTEIDKLDKDWLNG